MIFVGIDPGITGGIAAVQSDPAGHCFFCRPLDAIDGVLDVHALAETLDSLKVETRFSEFEVLIEKVGAMPKQGVSSTFKFGTTYGMIQGVVAAKGFRFRLVTPQAWTKIMLAGEDKSDKKNRAKLVARRLYPQLTFKATERSTTVHSGMADALLIAEYGRRTHGRG